MSSRIGTTVVIGKTTYIYIKENELVAASTIKSPLLTELDLLTELKQKADSDETQLTSTKSLPLPLGASTEIKQDSIIESLEVINFTLRLVELGVYTYIGDSIIGSNQGDAVWRIKRLDETTGLDILWADGNENFDNIWDNYLTLSYL